MSPIEIVVIIVVVLFVGFIFGREIYKHIQGKSSECSCCKNNMNRAIKKAKKAIYKKKCSCDK